MLFKSPRSKSTLNKALNVWSFLTTPFWFFFVQPPPPPPETPFNKHHESLEHSGISPYTPGRKSNMTMEKHPYNEDVYEEMVEHGDFPAIHSYSSLQQSTPENHPFTISSPRFLFLFSLSTPRSHASRHAGRMRLRRIGS